ncbi:MAG TPA: hypothetical protein DCS87_05040 [Rheinheimera sp.]|nr:hypothetical protein [Rheinheimera sp.]
MAVGPWFKLTVRRRKHLLYVRALHAVNAFSLGLFDDVFLGIVAVIAKRQCSLGWPRQHIALTTYTEVVLL